MCTEGHVAELLRPGRQPAAIGVGVTIFNLLRLGLGLGSDLVSCNDVVCGGHHQYERAILTHRMGAVMLIDVRLRGVL